VLCFESKSFFALCYVFFFSLYLFFEIFDCWVWDLMFASCMILRDSSWADSFSAYVASDLVFGANIWVYRDPFGVL
jgi:hypothetical protein